MIHANYFKILPSNQILKADPGWCKKYGGGGGLEESEEEYNWLRGWD